MLCENIHLLLICHQQHVVSLAYDLDWKYTGASLHLFIGCWLYGVMYSTKLWLPYLQVYCVGEANTWSTKACTTKQRRNSAFACFNNRHGCKNFKKRGENNKVLYNITYINKIATKWKEVLVPPPPLPTHILYNVKVMTISSWFSCWQKAIQSLILRKTHILVSMYTPNTTPVGKIRTAHIYPAAFLNTSYHDNRPSCGINNVISHVCREGRLLCLLPTVSPKQQQ